jgi:Tol biopolymer transport system component
VINGALALIACTIATAGNAATADRLAVEAPPALTAALEPALSPDSSEIAFAGRDAAGSVNLYVSPIDGGDVREIAADARLPVWSPDGRQIAFARPVPGSAEPRFQYVVALGDGSSSRVVATSGAETLPSWSANGRWLAFDGFESSMVARTDGTGSWLIPRSAGDTLFSSTSSRIAFIAVTGRSSLDIFTSSPVGSRRVRLTRNARDNVPLAWSRDGRRLLLESGRSGKQAIWIMDATGTHQHIVTAGRQAAYSASGNLIAVATSRGLLISDTAGRHQRLLVGGIVSNPTWSGDGRWIAFSLSAPAGTTPEARIEAVHPDGTGLHVIAPLESAPGRSG